MHHKKKDQQGALYSGGRREATDTSGGAAGASHASSEPPGRRHTAREGLDHVQFMLFQAVQFSSAVQSLSRVPLFAIPWTAARQASLSITISWSLLKLMSIESAMPSNHLILCRPLLLLPSILPNIRVFSNELVLRIRWLKYGVSASASVLPSNILFQAEDLYNM